MLFQCLQPLNVRVPKIGVLSYLTQGLKALQHKLTDYRIPFIHISLCIVVFNFDIPMYLRPRTNAIDNDSNGVTFHIKLYLKQSLYEKYKALRINVLSGAVSDI